MESPSSKLSNDGVVTSALYMALHVHRSLFQRRSQVASMEQGHEEELIELDLFQSHVADRLLSLLPTPDNLNKNSKDGKNKKEQLLSLAFLHKLLGVLLDCEEEFKALLHRSPTPISKPHLDRAVSDLLDRAVKSLDVCNAVTRAVQSLRHWHRHADIAASALHPPVRPAQLNRACTALNKLLAPSAPPAAHRQGSAAERTYSFGISRTLSLGRPRNPSSAKQVLAVPRGIDAAGLALAVYTMSSVLVFSMWALAAAFPCAEPGRTTAGVPAAPLRQVAWAGAMVGLQERIGEEVRRREKKGGVLVAEMQAVERCGRGLLDAAAAGAALEGEWAAELVEACRRLEEGIGPFERQVREVFHRIVGNRAEVLRCLDQSNRSSTLSIIL